MSLQNEPLGYDPNVRDDWTPAAGLRNAALRGVLVAGVLASVFAVLAATLPVVLLITALRTAFVFGVAWVLLRCVQRFAGMCGPACTALGLVLTFAVFLSNHLVWSIVGTPALPAQDSWLIFPAALVTEVIPTVDHRLSGWRWLHPYVLAVVNIGPFMAGGGLAAAFFGRD